MVSATWKGLLPEGFDPELLQGLSPEEEAAVGVAQWRQQSCFRRCLGIADDEGAQGLLPFKHRSATARFLAAIVHGLRVIIGCRSERSVSAGAELELLQEKRREVVDRWMPPPREAY